MDFALSGDQELLRDSLKQLLANECAATLLRAHMNDSSAADGLWAQVRDFSALGTGPLTDLYLAQQEFGYVAAPTPFFASAVLFAPLAARAGFADLDGVLEGRTTGTVAMAGVDGEWLENTEPTKTFVPDADLADFVAVVEPGSIRILQAGTAGARYVPTIDSTRRLFFVDTATLGAQVASVSVDPAELEDWRLRVYVALAAEMVGTAKRLLDMTLAYVKERIQFDVPLATFQAVQHRCANVSLDVERAESAVQFAAMAVDEADPVRFRAAHVAKAAAGTATTHAAKDAIQLHGGIGYTWEHDLHLYLRRSYATEHLLGNRDFHYDKLANLIFEPTG